MLLKASLKILHKYNLAPKPSLLYTVSLPSNFTRFTPKAFAMICNYSCRTNIPCKEGSRKGRRALSSTVVRLISPQTVPPSVNNAICVTSSTETQTNINILITGAVNCKEKQVSIASFERFMKY